MTRSVVGRGLLGSIADVATAAATTRVNPVALLAAGARHGVHFGALLSAAARRFGDRTALVDEFGELSYDELWDLAAARDLGPEPVAIQCEDDRWLLVGVGAAALSGADVTLVGPQGAPPSPHLPRVVVAADVAASTRGRARTRTASALTLLTTGSTGEPKSVERSRFHIAQMLPAASLIAALGLRPREPVLVLPPLFHGHGFSLATACLMVGAPIIVGPTASAVTLARQHRVGIVAGVPAQLHALVGADLPTVRLVAAGSARLPGTLATSLLESFDVVDFFGTTETGTATIARAGDLRAGTLGRPAAGVRISVADASGTLVARGTEGWVRVQSAFAVSGRTPLLSGDRGWIDASGRLVHAGRADGVTVSGGESVSAERLEQFLRAQPEIGDADVTIVPDDRLDSALAARVVLSAPLAADELRERVRLTLGRQYVPRDLELQPPSGSTASRTSRARSSRPRRR